METVVDEAQQPPQMRHQEQKQRQVGQDEAAQVKEHAGHSEGAWDGRGKKEAEEEQHG